NDELSLAPAGFSIMIRRTLLRWLCSAAAPLACVLALFPPVHAESQTSALNWKQLPPLPDRLGFAAPFAGVSSGALIVAGGANFPGAMPWEGGQKAWHDSIFVLADAHGPWLTN